ncbi:MAG: sugar ABC transporter ATP-binding protein, partial [Planctomycetota bacterium]
PTSSLSMKDAQNLFQVIARLKAEGVSVIYISHFLEEVFQVADRYTVLRNGEAVASGELSETDESSIIELMVGRSLDELFPRVPHEAGDAIVEIQGLSGATNPKNVDLTLRRGEILGLTGLVGAGRTELLRCLYGLDEVREGTIRVAEWSGTQRDPSLRVRQRLGLVSEDRKDEGLALERSIADNATLSDMKSIAKLGFIRPLRQHQAVSALIDTVSIKCRDPDQNVGDLSGGNQQKVAIARLLHQEAEIVLLDEPTRGIDVGSKVEVYRIIGELASQGKAVLFVSSYVPELLGVCDRIAVMSRGEIRGLRTASEWTEHAVMTAATGVSSA